METGDRAMRLYRGVHDLAKKLDDEKARWVTVVDIFTHSCESLRAKLRDYCEELIYQGNGRKIEDILWRKCFYEVFCTTKKLKTGNVWNDVEKALISSHLLAGAGFYNNLITGLQVEYNLELTCIPDIDDMIKQNTLINCISRNKFLFKNNGKDDKEYKRSILRFIHRSLIWMGDLERYRFDLEPLRIHWMMAVRYYRMANSLDHTIGMPHNQLGTVSGTQNYGLDAAYHYLRCILCTESFEGAESNLKTVITVHSYTGTEEITLHSCIARLLSLLQLWDSEVPNNDKINQESQALLNDIQNCLSSENIKETYEIEINTFYKQIKNTKPEYMTDDVMFKIISICLMFITKLQTKKLIQVKGATAFTLALLSQLVNFVTLQIQKAFINISMLSEKDFNFEDEHFLAPLNNVDLNDTSKNEISNSDPNDNAVQNKKPKKATSGYKSKSLLTKLRRSRRRMNSSDSDASDIDGAVAAHSSSDEINSDISETEEDLLSCDGMSDDDPSEDNEDSCKDSADESMINQVKQTQYNNETEHSKNIKQDDFINPYSYIRKQIKAIDVIDILSSNGMLSSIKMCYDWLKSDPDLLRKCARSTKSLVKRTCRLLNLISIDIKELLETMSNDNLVQDSNCWELYFGTEKAIAFSCMMPLPEDVELRGIPIFHEAHKILDWRKTRNRKMNPREETLMRVLKLVNFGEYLCCMKEYTGVVYDDKNHIFRVYSTDTDKMDESDILMTNDVQAEKVNEMSNYLSAELNEEHQENNTERDDVIVRNVIDRMASMNTMSMNPNLNSKNVRFNDDDNSKGKLMRNMGTLWLQAEVEALENRLHSRIMSPFLVPDHETLVKFMPSLKRLLYSKKFIVVIPTVVVSTLDEMKRHSAQAREATRWLEIQLKRGSRFLRAQRPQECLPLPLIKGPKPKDKESWLYFQIIECCYYLTQQTSMGLPGDPVESPIVTLLTGYNFQSNEETVRSSLTNSEILAKSVGVNIEHIQEFHSKWKASSKSHG